MKVILSIIYFLLISFFSAFVANKIYVLDVKETIVYLLFFAVFLFIYFIVTVFLGVQKLIRKRKTSYFFNLLLLTWIPLVGFPAYFYSLQSQENHQRQLAIKKAEHEKFTERLARIDYEISIIPDSAELYITRARVYRSVGQSKTAIAETQKSLQLKRTAAALWELGWNYEILEDYEKAKAAYEQAKIYFPEEDWVDVRLDVANRKLKE